MEASRNESMRISRLLPVLKVAKEMIKAGGDS